MSSGIRGLLGFQFWVDNSNKAPMEAMLKNKDRTPKDRAAILKELGGERRSGKMKENRSRPSS